MNVDYRSQFEVSSASAKKATGRSFDEWFAELDQRGGPPLGRRAIADWLFRELDVDGWWTTTLTVEYERARGVVEKDGLPKGYNICVTKTVAATTEVVFAQFADSSWWLGKSVKVAEGEPFNDGQGHTGVFKKITEDKLLRFSWNGARHHSGEVAEIKLSATGPRTSIVLNHDRLQTREAADGMREAWTHVLNTLKGRLS